EIHANARRLIQQQQKIWTALRREMETAGISILGRSRLLKADIAFLAEFFMTQVFPVLSPLAIDPAHPFPFIPNAGFVLALQLERRSDRRHLQALLPVPAQIERFIRLPARGERIRFLPLEDLLLLHLDRLFPGYAEA